MSKRMGTLLGFLVFAMAVSAAHLIEEGRGSSEVPFLVADK